MNHKFLFKLNVLYLGSLFFILLFLGSLMHRGAQGRGDAVIWSTENLDGIVVAGIYSVVFFISFLSYLYALWKTWKLTKLDKVINRTRLLAFGWLFGAPLFIYFTAMIWISAMRLITDPMFF